MCGRYTLIAVAEEIEKRFDSAVPPDYRPTYNAAPTQALPVITDADPGKLSMFHWGLVPSWARDRSIGQKMINARAETLSQKPSFREALIRRRCLVPADGFYEWKKVQGGQKQPYRIHLLQGELFAMAGLWEIWYDENREEFRSFTIVTVPANPAVAWLHDRMPLILPRESERKWLGGSMEAAPDPGTLVPVDAGKMASYPVSARVNSPRWNDERLIEGVDPEAGKTGSLFSL
jgi:putative SOS response-associated peptidase YedK